MLFETAVIFLCVLVVLCLVAIFYNRARRGLYRARFAERKEKPPAELVAPLGRGTHLTLKQREEIWVTVAQILNVPPGLLRPSDRLAVELRAFLFDDLDSERSDLVMYIQIAAQKASIVCEPQATESIADAVELLCRCRAVSELPSRNVVA